MLPPTLRTPLGVFTTQLLEGNGGWTSAPNSMHKYPLEAKCGSGFDLGQTFYIMKGMQTTDRASSIYAAPPIDSPVQTPWFLNSED